MTDAVRRQEHARADLAKRRRLFVDADAKSLRDQRVSGEQAANTATDDRNRQV